MRAAIVLVLAVMCAALPRAGPASGYPAAPAAGMPVVATFYPLFEFARRVGGERVAVRRLVPSGAEPHYYEPTPRDVVALTRARVIVYLGAGFEPWLDRLLPQLSAGIERVKTTEGMALAPTGGGRAVADSHVWLDPLLAQRQIDAVLAGLLKADPSGRTTYEANAAAYKARLAGLHERFTGTLGRCRQTVFIVSHAAFGYLAARYGLTQVAIGGPTPEAEPSPARIRAILKTIRRYDVRVIYHETLTSPRVVTAVAREIGARTLVLNPIEGLTDAEERQGKDYLSIMDDNLRNLAQGLDCR